MTIRLRCRLSTRGALLALVAGLTLPLPALAQKSLGSGGGSGPVMTREELRTCLKQQARLTQSVAAFDSERSALEKEKAEILALQKAIDDARGGVQADAAKINDVNRRAEDLSRRVTDWNERWAAFEKEGRSGPFADRERRRLQQEQRAMNKEEADLNAEREALGGVGSGASEVNAKVDALNARTAAWNMRNGAIAKRSEDLTQERDLWAAECGSRRYREDDEIAIQQGK